MPQEPSALRDSEAERAIQELNGHEIGGRKLTVTEARERSPGGGGRSRPRAY